MISDSLHAIKTIGVAFRRDRLGYTLRVALLVCTPAIGFYAVLVYFNYSLADFTLPPERPGRLFSGVAVLLPLWMERRLFHDWRGTPPASFSRMGVHGPFFPAPYGLLGRCVGFSYVSGPLLQSLDPLCRSRRLLCTQSTFGQAGLVAGAFFLTYWPYYAFVYSWMQDILHLAVAVILAGIFTALLSRTPLSAPVWFRVAAVVFVCAAALLRISWALILPPLFLLFLRRYTYKTVAAALLASVPSILALTTIFRWLCAPYFESPDGISHE